MMMTAEEKLKKIREMVKAALSSRVYFLQYFELRKFIKNLFEEILKDD